MMLRIVCTCGHIGVVSAESLPRELQCSVCGSTRHVEVRHCRRVASHDSMMERLTCAAKSIEAPSGG